MSGIIFIYLAGGKIFSWQYLDQKFVVKCAAKKLENGWQIQILC